ALLGSVALPIAFMAILLLALFILSFAAFGEIASIFELAAQGIGAQLGPLGTFTPKQVEALVAWSIVLLTVVTLAASVLALSKYAVRLFGARLPMPGSVAPSSGTGPPTTTAAPFTHRRADCRCQALRSGSCPRQPRRAPRPSTFLAPTWSGWAARSCPRPVTRPCTSRSAGPPRPMAARQPPWS